MLKNLIGLLFFGVIFYGLSYVSFVRVGSVNEFPILKERLGTTLWHSDTGKGMAQHLYCYYPTSNATYSDKGSEYILKRANSLNDCQNYLGQIIYREAKTTTEREKLWWNQTEMHLGEIASLR